MTPLQRIIERRGVVPATDRKVMFCSGCNATSIFTKVEDRPELLWQCIGDQRSPRRHPGCGKIVEDRYIRPYG